jgi:hypothetical protein
MFSVEEANAMLPVVSPTLERLRAAQAVIADTHEELVERSKSNGGGEEGKDFLEAISAAGRGIAELQEAGIVVRDPATGLIDFPSERDGEQIFLCWRLGEQRVAWWHPTTSGFADRRPL